MISPLRERQIPLRVRNVFKPQQPGTLVQEQSLSVQPGLRAVTMIQGLGMSAPQSGPLGDIANLVDDNLSAITGSRTDVMISSQSSSRTFACFVITTSAGPDALRSLQFSLREGLEAIANGVPWTVRPVTVVTVIGSKLEEIHALTAEILLALEGIPLLAVAHGPANCSLSLVVEPEYGDATLTRIHNLILRTSEKQ